MVDQNVLKCIDFLKKRFIKVQTEWCEACLEWIAEENNGLPNLNELTNLVYEQWLLADLREIAAPTFHSEIREKKGFQVLQGSYCAQVNSVIDIGHSAYSQLSKIKGNEIDDVGDDEEDDNLKQFFRGKQGEKKSANHANSKWQKETFSRMLFMEIHDGHQIVEAIEYKPISHLSIENVTPGIKVLLTGPITLRDGLMLLKPNNIKLLGGSVEELVDASSHLDTLCQLLRIDGGDKAKLCKDTKAIEQQVPAPSTTSSTVIPDKSKTNSTKQKKEELDGFDDNLFINDVFDDIDIDDTALSQEIDETMLTTTTTTTTNLTNNIVNRPNQNRNNCSISNINYCAPYHVAKSKQSENIKQEENVDLIDANIFFGDDDDFDIKTPGSTVRKKSCTTTAIMVRKSSVDEEDKVQSEFITEPVNEPKVSAEFKTEMSLSELIDRDEPFEGVATLKKAWFTTLTSTLTYNPCYRLTAIITNGEEFLEVVLGNEALYDLVGFSSSQVTDAVKGKLCNDMSRIIKSAIKETEKSLEERKWCLDLEFDKNEDMFSVIRMGASLVRLPNL